MASTGAALPLAQVLQGLAPKSIRRPRSNPFYLLSLWLVTLLCVLIPLAYFGLIALIGWLEYAYYTSFAPKPMGSGIVWRLLAWVIPGFVGGVLILFLLKPLFAPRRKTPQAVTLDEGEEPAFTAAIHALCGAIGTRPPVQIRLSHEVNAWVQFEGGFFGFLFGRKLLTVGLPLVAGMSARHFVGVLAHEFGHFAQGGGMRSAYLINTVNAWLFSRAYERDEWDERLERWGSDEDSSGYWQLAVGITALCLWLTRGVLRGLFQVSFRMSRRLSQEMEFDADRYEAIVAGSQGFRETALRLRALAHAWRETDRVNAAAWREGKLVDDLPASVHARLEALKQREWEDIALELDADHETRYWDSHPADQARIANAETLQATGLFLDERPARQLFEDFSSLARRVTTHYYEQMGLSFGESNFIGVQQLWKLNRLDDAVSEAWARYTNGMIGERSVLLSPREGARSSLLTLGWQSTVDELRRIGPETIGLWQRLGKKQERADELALWVALIDLDVDFALPVGVADYAVLREEYAACSSQDSDDHRLADRVLALFARRLQFAIDMMPEGEDQLAVTRMAVLQHLHGHWPKVRALAQSRTTLLRLHAGMPPDDAELRAWVHARAVDYRRSLLEMLGDMDAIALSDEEILGKHLRNRCGHLSSAGDDPIRFLQVTSPIEQAFLHAYRSLLGGLAAQADLVERTHGIKPIRLVIPQPHVQARG
ncbi:MAG TPA: M48 family metalloprotease [Lysobacter sp.]|nr:M48 family metalloprotease [Lysobacter sp.]